jgi:hypothetical protein
MAPVAERITADEFTLKARKLTDLVSVSEHIGSIKRAIPDALAREQGLRAIEDAVLDLASSLPEGTGNHDAGKLFEFTVELRRALTDDPADASGDAELAVIKMLDAVGRIERRLRHDQLDDPQTAARWILTLMDGVEVSDLARLLGVSTKTVGNWRRGAVVKAGADRVVLVAQLLTYLRGSLTPRGLMMWMDAPRDQLEGRTPVELLDGDLPTARLALTPLARTLRG